MASRRTVEGALGDGGRLWANIQSRALAAAALCIAAAGVSSAQETPTGIIAAHIRQQGFACKEPRQAERDAQASKPNEAVWILTCENATYRVTLVPNMAARVEVKR